MLAGPLLCRAGPVTRARIAAPRPPGRRSLDQVHQIVQHGPMHRPIILFAACTQLACAPPSTPAAPAGSKCDRAGLESAETAVSQGRLRTAIKLIEAAPVCPEDRARAVVLRVDVLLRLGRYDDARRQMQAERASLDAAHTRVFTGRLEMVAGWASAAPASIEEALSDLARGHQAAALEGFNRALVQDGDDVRALTGAGQALRALDREREASERFDHALDVAERTAHSQAEPVVVMPVDTRTDGTRAYVWPNPNEQKVFFANLHPWQPLQVIEHGRIAAQGSLAVSRAAGGAWSLISPRTLRGPELGKFDNVAVRPDGSYVLGCSEHGRTLFDGQGKRIADSNHPCASASPRWLGDTLVELGEAPLRIVVTSVPKLDQLVETPSGRAAEFDGQQVLLVAGSGAAEPVRVVDLRAGTVAAVVQGRQLSIDGFALSPDGKRLLWQDALEVFSQQLPGGAPASLGKAKVRGDAPMGYLPDGRACIQSQEQAAGAVVRTRGSAYPVVKPPKDWTERCVVHADRTATAVLVPARSKLLPRSTDASFVYHEGVSADRKLAAFVEVAEGKKPQVFVVIVSTDPANPRVVQRVALAQPKEPPLRLAFSRDGSKVMAGATSFEVSTGAASPAFKGDDAVFESMVVAFREEKSPDGPPGVKLTSEVLPPTLVSPGPSITLMGLLDPGGKHADAAPIALASPITVERDRAGVVRWSDRGKALAAIVPVGDPPRYVVFSPDRKVELIGEGAAPEQLRCRVGAYLLPFDLCREETLVRGRLLEVVTGTQQER